MIRYLPVSRLHNCLQVACTCKQTAYFSAFMSACRPSPGQITIVDSRSTGVIHPSPQFIIRKHVLIYSYDRYESEKGRPAR